MRSNLIDTLKTANSAYETGYPVLSDREYDYLLNELEKSKDFESEKAREILDWIGSQDPSENKVQHAEPMLSLAKKSFDQPLSKYQLLHVSSKLDGIALSLTYVKGKLKVASLRGDGKKGKDVTSKIKNSNVLGIPLHLSGDAPLRFLTGAVIRGELVMPFSVYEKKYKDKYVSPRNAVAALMNAKKGTVDGLQFYSYGALLPPGMMPTDTLFFSYFLSLIERTGVGLRIDNAVVKTYKEAEAWFNALREKEHKIPTEGVVITEEVMSDWKSWGSTRHHPKWAFAVKFPVTTGETRVIELKVLTGKTGRKTPIALVEPILLDGRWIRKVNLHSLKTSAELGIELGSKVLIEYNTVPKIVKVL